MTDRLVVTLAHLRWGSCTALAVAFGVDRATITRAIDQIRPLLAGCGFATATGVGLTTLADVFAYTAAEGVMLRMDATSDPGTPSPRAGRGGRNVFVSGKLRQHHPGCGS